MLATIANIVIAVGCIGFVVSVIGLVRALRR